MSNPVQLFFPVLLLQINENISKIAFINYFLILSVLPKQCFKVNTVFLGLFIPTAVLQYATI